jgi:hypothetical protein
VCKECKGIEDLGDGKAAWHIYNAPHEWLDSMPEAIDRASYFESIRLQLDAWVTALSICPQNSDRWLSGETDMKLTRDGIRPLVDAPDDVSSLVDAPEPTPKARYFDDSGAALQRAWAKIARSDTMADEWLAGEIEMRIDVKGVRFVTKADGLSVTDSDWPGQYL